MLKHFNKTLLLFLFTFILDGLIHTNKIVFLIPVIIFFGLMSYYFMVHLLFMEYFSPKGVIYVDELKQLEIHRNTLNHYLPKFDLHYSQSQKLYGYFNIEILEDPNIIEYLDSAIRFDDSRRIVLSQKAKQQFLDVALACSDAYSSMHRR